MHQRRSRAFQPTTLLLSALFLACSSSTPAPSVVPLPSPEDLEASLFLIGDAGKAEKDDQVLGALTRAASQAANSTIVFLGDNIYYYGMPDSTALDRKVSEDRLRWQVNVGLNSRAPTYIIPGNHDWENGRDSGWAAIRRQEAFIAQEGGDVVKLVPSGGCPGPMAIDIPGRFRLVILDSQWFLHGGPKPTEECRPGTVQGVVDSLTAVLNVPAGLDAVVALHHPLQTHGTHGGYFPLADHIFPLRNLVHWLYLPLPIIGSLYPIARRSGASDQDLAGTRNVLMRRRLREAFAPRPPRVVAAGHEHTLQVISDSSVPTLLVSGSGYDNHVEPVAWRADTRYAGSVAGFMRLDRLKDGRLRLSVVRPKGDGVEELHSEWLPAVRR
jgi:hypothetical protein